MKERTALGVLACAVLLSVCSSRVEATAGDDGYDTVFHPDDMNDGLVRDLVRVMISESGFHDPREHAALGHTIARRARRLRRVRGWTARQTIRSLSTRTLVEPRTRRQHWLHALDLDGMRPSGWHTWADAEWTYERSQGLKITISEARRLLRGELEDPCDGPSELWGSRTHPVDAAAFERGVARGVFVEVSCGLDETRYDNRYVRWGTRAERRAAQRRLRRATPRVTYVD